MEKLIDERTRFIYVNDPSNPLGVCWSNEQKIAILKLCERKGVPLLCDEIYEGLIYDMPEQCLSFAELSPSSSVTIFKCSGLTKRYLAPGWRLGWIIVYANNEKRKIYNRYLRSILNLILMPNTLVQVSLPAIIVNSEHEEHLQKCFKIMQYNKQLLANSLSTEPYCSIRNSSGALYACIVFDPSQLDYVGLSTQ